MVEASRREKEAVAFDGEKEAVAVGGKKEAVAVGGRSKAAAADERHRQDSWALLDFYNAIELEQETWDYRSNHVAFYKGNEVTRVVPVQ
ncbi:hypothetical protein L2E82_33024 [Cichorium intybus]|uniref:Uncharacterized protein n=1 Tax=Cichorium intybus TaxID=13427 RepID=A0ACB9BHL5_CICIN|nr:hypothetical protein L2E82_33024 [Cichorium intybus]